MRDLAAKAPFAILLLIGVVFAFELMFLGAQETPGPNQEAYDPGASKFDDINNSSDETFGFVSTVAGLVDAIIDFIKTMFDLLTFNIPGAPTVVRFPITVGIVGGLAWSIATLFRGN